MGCPRISSTLFGNSVRNEMISANSIYEKTPNFSMRMTSISAILVSNQLSQVGNKIEKFNRNWWLLYTNLNGYIYENKEIGCNICIEVAPRLPDEEIVGTSFLFNVIVNTKDKPDSDKKEYSILETFSKLLSEHGVTCAWFGRKQCLGFTSTFKHWRYINSQEKEEDEALKERINDTMKDADNFSSNDVNKDGFNLPRTNTFLSTLFDIPLYHTSTWDENDFLKICQIIKTSIQFIRI